MTSDFTLDDAAQAAIGRSLNLRGVRIGCPSCRRPRQLLDSLSMIPMQSGDVIPCAVLLCPACGLLMTHALVALGLRLGAGPEMEAEAAEGQPAVEGRPTLDLERFAPPAAEAALEPGADPASD